jgi:ABC-type amino acid transport substrate-binding protein
MLTSTGGGRMANRRWRLAAWTLLAAALAGCGGAPSRGGAAVASQDPAPLTAAPGVVRAGTCPPDRPGMPLSPNRLEAFQGELLRRVGYKLALRMRVSDLPSCDRAAAALADRSLDLVVTAPGGDTGRRAGPLVTEPYLVVQYALLVPADSPRNRDGLAALRAGTRVGVQAGTAGARWARVHLGRRGVAAVPVPGERAAAGLAAGRYQAVILPRAGAIRATRTQPVRIDRLLEVGEQGRFLVAASNPALRARVDSMLEQIVYDGSYATIFSRHFAPTPLPVDFLPPD